MDCFIPSKKLAFEFQGEQHYDKKSFFHSSTKKSFQEQIYRDKAKRDQCKKKGIVLIEITNENWNLSEEGLKKIIDENYIK